jgi:ADP-ribosylation factor related protein 1
VHRRAGTFVVCPNKGPVQPHPCITSLKASTSTPPAKKVCPPHPLPIPFPLQPSSPNPKLTRSPPSIAEYSILLLGLDNAGKTTLLEQIRAIHSSTHHPNLKTVPTVGQNVATVSLPDLYLKIWDVGGQHALRGLWQSYYASCHAIVFVIDSSDVGDADIAALASGALSGSGGGGGAQGRLEECRMVLEDVLQNEDTEGVPLLVLANKQDREDCVEVVRIKEGLVRKVFEGEKGGSVRDSRVLPCSALTGTGVQEAVEWLCSRVKWNKESRPPVMR